MFLTDNYWKCKKNNMACLLVSLYTSLIYWEFLFFLCRNRFPDILTSTFPRWNYDQTYLARWGDLCLMFMIKWYYFRFKSPLLVPIHKLSPPPPPPSHAGLAFRTLLVFWVASRLFTVPYFSVGFSRLIHFEQTAVILVCNGERNLGRVSKHWQGAPQFRHSPQAALTITNQDGGSSKRVSLENDVEK